MVEDKLAVAARDRFATSGSIKCAGDVQQGIADLLGLQPTHREVPQELVFGIGIRPVTHLAALKIGF